MTLGNARHSRPSQTSTTRSALIDRVKTNGSTAFRSLPRMLLPRNESGTKAMNRLSSNEAQIAKKARPLEYKLPLGNPPSLTSSLKAICIVSIEIYHRTNRVRIAEKTRLEIRGRIGTGLAVVDVDDGGAE